MKSNCINITDHKNSEIFNLQYYNILKLVKTKKLPKFERIIQLALILIISETSNLNALLYV